jgi:hypothetical protein
MNTELELLIAELRLSDAGNESVRWRFVCACAERVQHLLEDAEVRECVRILGEHAEGRLDPHTFAEAQARAALLANRHRGSPSIDGCGHAAVSASYAVANALAGKAVATADYSAYAMAYAQGGAAAVANRESFELEFAWQIETLKSVAQAATA